MIHRILLCALAAGFAAGLAVTIAQMATVLPLIEQAVAIEQMTPPGAAVDGPSLLETFLANAVTGVGFGFLLLGAIAMAGRPVDFRRGLIWGVGGFFAFALLPALGLPPKPPGVPGPPLAEAQTWWLLCIVLSAVGLLIGAFSKRWAGRIFALALIVAPHVWGAPPVFGTIDPALQAMMLEFRLASLTTSAIFWSVLGGTAGLVYRKVVI